MIIERITLFFLQLCLIGLLTIVGIVAVASFAAGEIVPGIGLTIGIIYVAKKVWLK